MNSPHSHIPVLGYLAQYCLIESVLELGPGNNSTRVFTDEKAFPDLVKFDSYENASPSESAWIKMVQEYFVGKDVRYQLHLISGSIARAISVVDTSFYNLVVVDDSGTLEERIETIKVVIPKSNLNNIILIHDFEHYSSCVDYGEYCRFIFDDILPFTALLWKKQDLLSLDKLQRCKELILTTFAKCGDNIHLWKEVFKNELVFN